MLGRLRRWLHEAPSPTNVDLLTAPEGYRLWAPTYDSETATSFLDEELAQAMLSGLPRTRLLHAGCGVGRRIEGIPDAMGIDLSPEMLSAGSVSNVIAGDIRSMPLPPDLLTWCGVAWCWDTFLI